jgi:hypothetical protein
MALHHKRLESGMCFYFGCGNVVNKAMWLAWVSSLVVLPLLCLFVYSRLTSFECTSALMTAFETIQKVGSEVQDDPEKMESAKQALYSLADDFFKAQGPFSTSSSRDQAPDGDTSIAETVSEHRDVFVHCFVDVTTSCKISISSVTYLTKAFLFLLSMTFWPCVFFVCCAGCVNRVFKYANKKIPVAPPKSKKS